MAQPTDATGKEINVGDRIVFKSEYSLRSGKVIAIYQKQGWGGRGVRETLIVQPDEGRYSGRRAYKVTITKTKNVAVIGAVV